MSDPTQLERYVQKNTPSLDRLERLRAVGIMLEVQGDEQGARDMDFVVGYFTHIRQTTGKPTEPKMGGMDRRGIPRGRPHATRRAARRPGDHCRRGALTREPTHGGEQRWQVKNCSTS